MERSVMQSKCHGGPWAFAAKDMDATAGIDESQRADLDKFR
jgi:hypothetical protein